MKKWYEQNYVSHRDWILDNMENLGLDCNEVVLVLLIDFMNEHHQEIDLEGLSNKLNKSQDELDRVLSTLCARSYLSIFPTSNGSKWSLNGLFEADSERSVKVMDRSLFDTFESEFGRPLSEREMEKLNEWVKSTHKKLIIYALRQASLDEKLSFPYIDKIILSEWLIKMSSNGDETYIFNREVDQNISHAESEIDYQNMEEKYKMDFYLEGFSENISDAYKKKTILSDIALRTTDKKGVFAEIRKVYEWFASVIILFPESKYNGLNEVAADDDKKRFFSALMNYFDTGIDSVEGESQQMDFDKILDNIPRTEAEKIKVDISNAANEHPIMFKVGEQIFILHKDENGNIVYNKLLLNHGNLDDMFDYTDESDGTKRLFDLIPIFYENGRGSLILIDEIDRSLHTNLTRKFLELFFEIVEDRECQLVATTHDSNLLDLELLRQDEIWFVERQADHSSKVFSLNRFKERFDKKIDKEYLLGRYGAIPIFDDDFVLEDAYEE